MSIGDLGNSLNRAGKDLYASQRARILRESKEHEKIVERRELDRKKHDIVTKRFHHKRITDDISMVRREILSLNSKRGGNEDVRQQIAEKERRIRSLEIDQRKFDAESRKTESDIRNSESKLK